MEELQIMQSQVAVQKPPNGGNLTLLIMHLFKTIVTTPQKDTDTTHILWDINFESFMNQFGIFFIPGLEDKNKFQVDCLELDSEELIQHLSKIKGGQKAQIVHPLQNDTPTAEHPSWQLIVDTMATDPESFVKPPTQFGTLWEPRNIGLWTDVANLMVKFGWDYWLTLHKDFFINGEYPNVTNWDDVIKIWSIAGIKQIICSPGFNAHKSFWDGLPCGQQHQSFVECRDTFFPPLDVTFPDNSIWKLFKESGYIKDYHNLLQGHYGTEAAKLHLNDGIASRLEMYTRKFTMDLSFGNRRPIIPCKCKILLHSWCRCWKTEGQ